MHLILNDGSGIPLNTKSKRKILIKAALVYKLHWGSRKKKMACSPEFTVFISKSISQKTRERAGGGIAQLVVLGLAVHSVTGSILLRGHFPVEGIFPLELTWVQTPVPQKLLRMRV